ncbi:hypothetical protein ES708_23230 [subsurface metagenome]
MAWVSPTGHDDPDNAWIQEDHAYDEATGTYTFTSPYVPPLTWSGFIELTHAALPCDKVRFFAEITLGYFEIVDLDVYYGGDWHHVYQGGFATRTWVEKALGNTYSVTKARLRSYNKNSLYSYGFILYEFDFWAEVVAPTVTTPAVSDIAATTATGNGNMTDNGGENASKRGVCWNTTGNPTVADDKSEETDSFGVGAFTRPMTGLTPEQHYYVKAYAYNSAGYGYGGQVEFDTPPAYTIHEVEVSDGIALADNLVKTPMLFKSDGLALSDVLVKTPIKTLVDGIAFKDILIKTMDKRLTDAIAFKDTLVKTMDKRVTDGIAFKDVISYLKNPTKLAKLIRKLLQLEGIGGGKEDAISYGKGPTKLAKLIRKLLQLEDIGGGKED